MNWKNYQQKFKLRRVFRKAVGMGVAAVAAALVILGILFVRWWNGSVGSGRGGCGEKVVFVKGQQVNFLVAARTDKEAGLSDLAAVSLGPEEETLQILQIPIDIEVHTSVGNYAIKELLNVGEALNPPRPLDYLVESLENYLAIPIDGEIIVHAQDLGASPILGGGDSILDLHQRAGSPLFWWRWFKNRKIWENQIQTRFTRSQFWGLVFTMRKVREDRIEIVSLADKAGFEEVGVRDKTVQTLFIDAVVEQEDLTARVLNGTTIPGLASEGARFLENLGIKVLVVDNYERTDISETQILIYRESALSRRSSQRLKRIFKISEINQVADSSVRADMDVVIGEDW